MLFRTQPQVVMLLSPCGLGGARAGFPAGVSWHGWAGLGGVAATTVGLLPACCPIKQPEQLPWAAGLAQVAWGKVVGSIWSRA